MNIPFPFVIQGNLIKAVTIPQYLKVLPTLKVKGLFKASIPRGGKLGDHFRTLPNTTMLSHLQNYWKHYNPNGCLLGLPMNTLLKLLVSSNIITVSVNNHY